MLFTVCIFVCVLGALNGGSVPLGNLKQYIVDFHNNLRRNEGAANMKGLIWNEKLANEAARWINRCEFEHEMKGRGENLAYDTNPGDVKTIISGSMQRWFDEKKDFSWAAQSCQRSCHYTQMVWAETSEIGCAVERCPMLNTWGRFTKNALFLACYYNPRGNMGNKIYIRGKACSKCPSGSSCDDKLCYTGGKEQSGGAQGSPAKEICTDGHKNCQGWARFGECERNPWWMLKNCKKSCRVC